MWLLPHRPTGPSGPGPCDSSCRLDEDRVTRLVLIHWNKSEAPARASRLERLGYLVDTLGLNGPELLRSLRENPPSGFVIDLSRLPSHGTAVAIALRRSAATRLVPIVFVDGDPAKVNKAKAVLPDARYTHWTLIGPVLEHALANPPKEVVSPGAMDSYGNSPLAKKLGISAGAHVVLIGAPKGFEAQLGDLPEGATLYRSTSRTKGKVVILFARTTQDLQRGFGGALRHMAEKGALWIAWPKKTSGFPSDLTQQWVRQFGMSHGLVDYKICAIDATWSGLRFARRQV